MQMENVPNKYKFIVRVIIALTYTVQNGREMLPCAFC